MESLPPEILRLILGGTNLSIVRLVSQRMNQLGSVLLLESRTKSLHVLVGRLMVVVSEKTNKLLDREDQRLELVLKTSEELAQLEKEISALEVRVREKQSSVDVLLGTALPPAQRQQLLRLCDLHSEFVCFAALRERAVRLGKVLLQEGGQAPFDWDRAQAPPPRRGLMEPRRDPVLPHGFDPYGEPDPDHLHWRGGDDDEIPDYPGLYGPPGRNDPFGGGGGGLRDPRHDPLREPPRPGFVNPDWERDRLPMGYDPMNPGGLPFPGGPFPGRRGGPPGPGAPPNPFNPRGGGSFGGPRFL